MGIVVPAGFEPVDPSAHPLVLTGARGERFQVTVLEDWLVRVQMLPDGHPRLNRTWTVVDGSGDTPREGRLRDDLSPFSMPDFEAGSGGEGLKLQTAEVRLTIARDDLRLLWHDAQGNRFAADLGGRAYPYDRTGRTVSHYMERRPDEHYYGFGERAGPLDKRGMRMRMFNADALGYDAEAGDPLYKHFPFYVTLVPELDVAYGLFYDNLATTIFDMGREIDAYYGPYRYYQAEDGDIDYYLIYGPTIEQVVERFSALTGRIALPPRWSLGYQSSSMSYTESHRAQDELERFAGLFDEHRIPCDLFHMSSGYTKGSDDKRYVFNWNRDGVPDPERLVARFHEAGIKMAANIKPCLLCTHPMYDEVREVEGFIRASDTEEPEVSMFWGGRGSYLDFTNPGTFEWWKRMVLDRLLAYGIDATWNDNNEFEIQDGDARCAGFGEAISVGLIRPVHTLLMTRASYEAQQEARQDERPFLISRSGCPGIQRYAQTWSGDNTTSWHTLRYNIPMGLGLGLSGVPNTGHDVGGLVGDRPDPELLVRWVQNGAFHPRFNMHSWNPDGSATEAWMYPEVLPIIRKTIEFRYRLLPYLYTLFFQAARTGRPVIRPLVYAFPHDTRCHTESFDFLLGPNLLVASVLEKGARTREIYLPEGRAWCDFYTGEWHRGGRTVEVEAPLDRIPLFVPEGGIVPMGRALRHVGEKPDDLRRIHVFPHPQGGSSTFELIEDDGISLGYGRGEHTTVALEVTSDAEGLTIGTTPARGGFPLPYSELEFVFPPGEKRPVRSEKAPERTWTDEQDRKHMVVPIAPARTVGSHNG
ncbi:MAG: TIM-barrel domain-containing protein [Rubrobacteraceae bacterium]